MPKMTTTPRILATKYKAGPGKLVAEASTLGLHAQAKMPTTIHVEGNYATLPFMLKRRVLAGGELLGWEYRPRPEAPEPARQMVLLVLND